MVQEGDIKAYYAARAAEYDRIYEKPERQRDLGSIAEWLTDRFAQKHVLEIACGTGYWTQFIASVASSMVAMDSSPETLQIARQRIAQRNVKFVVDDAFEIGRVGGGFNAVFAGFWFSHVPLDRRRSFLIKVNSVSMPSATVVLIDNRFVEDSSSPVSRTDTDGNTFQSRRLDDGSTHEIIKNFPEEQELLDAVAGLGLKPRFRTWQYFWALEYETMP